MLHGAARLTGEWRGGRLAGMGGQQPQRILSLECCVCGHDFQVPQGYAGGMTCPLCLGEEPGGLVGIATTEGLPGYRAVETLGLVAIETIVGLGTVQQLLKGLTDMFGGRSGTVQAKFAELRGSCLAGLEEQALEKGANAIVGLRLSYSNFPGVGAADGLLMLAAVGTAVRVERERRE